MVLFPVRGPAATSVGSLATRLVITGSFLNILLARKRNIFQLLKPQQRRPYLLASPTTSKKSRQPCHRSTGPAASWHCTTASTASYSNLTTSPGSAKPKQPSRLPISHARRQPQPRTTRQHPPIPSPDPPQTRPVSRGSEAAPASPNPLRAVPFFRVHPTTCSPMHRPILTAYQHPLQLTNPPPPLQLPTAAETNNTTSQQRTKTLSQSIPPPQPPPMSHQNHQSQQNQHYPQPPQQPKPHNTDK
jgi:hypothetical protein